MLIKNYFCNSLYYDYIKIICNHNIMNKLIVIGIICLIIVIILIVLQNNNVDTFNDATNNYATYMEYKKKLLKHTLLVFALKEMQKNK